MGPKTFSLLALLLYSISCPAQQSVDIKLHDAEKGIISMQNNFSEKDLGDCRIIWTLLENGHPIEIAQINNIKAEPGSTAFLEFPYANKPFVYGGERWIRIEIKKKKDTKDESDEKILAWAQFFLPETSSPPPKEVAPEKMPQIVVHDGDHSIRFSNKIFSLSFDKKTGLIFSLKYYDTERFISGPELALKPDIELANRELILIEHKESRSDNTSTITTETIYKSDESKPIIKYTADYTILGDGTIIIDSALEILNEDIRRNMTWIGLKTVLSRIYHIDWYGDREDRPTQIYNTDAADITELKSRTTGMLSNIRWLGLTDKFCRGTMWCNNDNNLSAQISIEKDKMTKCLIGKETCQQDRVNELIKFSIRIHRYDTVLMFPDKLWYIKLPPKKTHDTTPKENKTHS